MPIVFEIPDSDDENETPQIISPVKKLDKGKGRAISATPAKAPVVYVDLSQESDSSTEPDEPALPPPSAKKRKFDDSKNARTPTRRAPAQEDSDVEVVYSPQKAAPSVTRRNLIDGPIPSIASSSSSSSSLPPPPAPPLIDVDADAAMAARLSAQWEAEQEAELAREASDELLARMTEKAEKMNEKAAEMRRKRGARTVNDSKIIFQVTMDGEGNTLEGDHDADNAAHLALVKADFNQQYLGIKIKKVTYFVNLALNERFENAKIALGQAERDDTERTLFHGTAEKNVQPILENGFKIGGVDGQVLHGQAYGVGVYLASSPATSLGYTQGCSKMFACRVLLGKQTATAMRGNPLPVGQNDFDAYANGTIFVARHADQVLPRYVVEFEYAYAQPGYGLPGGVVPPNMINNPAAAGVFGAIFAGAGLPVPAPPVAGAVPALNNGWNPYVQAPGAVQGAVRAPRAKRARKGAARKA